MIEKGKLYRFCESLVPPIMLAPIKRTGLYRSIAKRADNFTSVPPAEIVTVSEGLLQGFKLKFNPHGTWQKEMLSGHYDHELFSALEKMDLKGKVVYDIGAHICYHSLAFAKIVGSEGQVFAFEPNAVNNVRAKEILALNPTVQNNISLQEIALADTIGTATFLCTNDLEGGSSTGGFLDDASTIWERSIYIDKIAFKEITVPQDTIDNLVATKKILPPDVLKIDVEGAEQLVLGGATETLRTYHPTIIVEFHSIFSAYRCMDILLAAEYTTTVLKREPDGRVMILAK
jgi:FkbM family methyltransferase